MRCTLRAVRGVLCYSVTFYIFRQTPVRIKSISRPVPSQFFWASLSQSIFCFQEVLDWFPQDRILPATNSSQPRYIAGFMLEILKLVFLNKFFCIKSFFFRLINSLFHFHLKVYPFRPELLVNL